LGAAIPNLPDDDSAVEFDPRVGARERMLEARYVSLPATNVEVEIVLPISLGDAVPHSIGCLWKCRNGMQEIAKRACQNTRPDTAKRIHCLLLIHGACSLEPQFARPGSHQGA
jgi:hypothetical protein